MLRRHQWGNTAHLFEVCWREDWKEMLLFDPLLRELPWRLCLLQHSPVPRQQHPSAGGQWAHRLLCPEAPWDVSRRSQPATHLLPPHTVTEPDHRIPQKGGIREVIFLEESTRLTQWYIMPRMSSFPFIWVAFCTPFPSTCSLQTNEATPSHWNAFSFLT